MPEALYSPNAYARLPVVSHHTRFDQPYHPLRTYEVRTGDHQLLSLLTATGLDPDLLLRDGELVLRRVGENGYLEEGAVLFSPDRRLMTTHTNQIHRRGGAIQFPDKSRFPKNECWTLMLNPSITHIRSTYQRRVVEPAQTAITRADRQCSVCLDDLSGDLATCPNQHQVHRQCYEGLNPHRRACPECRTQYSPEEQTRLAVRPDRTLLHKRLIYLNETRPNADRRFVALLKGISTNGETATYALLDTLDCWVRRPRTDYLLDCGDDGTPFFNGFDRPAWRDFLTYYLSAENRDRLVKRDLTPTSYNANYGEAEFLADLLRSHPTDAQEVLARVRTETEKTALRRECWVKHRLTDATPTLLRSLSRFIERPQEHTHRRLLLDEVVLEA